MISTRSRTALAVMAGLSLCGAAGAQTFPSKVVRIVATSAGGSGDFAARLIAQGLNETYPQQVIVENRADGLLASEAVVKAPADGHTLLVNGSNLWLLQYLRERVPWDPLKSFAPITLAVATPNLLVIHPSVPAKSVRDLISLARARPGALNYATSGTGVSTHLSAELFKSMAKLDMVRVNYKGTSPALNDLIAGQVQVMFSTTASAPPFVKTGRLRALAVTSAKPSALVPGVPTVADEGLPGYESVGVLSLFAPAGTPAPVLTKLTQDVNRILTRADIREKFFVSGAEVVASTPEQLTAHMRSEMASMGKVIREAGIRDE